MCALLFQLTRMLIWRFEKGRNPKTFPQVEKDDWVTYEIYRMMHTCKNIHICRLHLSELLSYFSLKYSVISSFPPGLCRRILSYIKNDNKTDKIFKCTVFLQYLKILAASLCIFSLHFYPFIKISQFVMVHQRVPNKPVIRGNCHRHIIAKHRHTLCT